MTLYDNHKYVHDFYMKFHRLIWPMRNSDVKFYHNCVKDKMIISRNM